MMMFLLIPLLVLMTNSHVFVAHAIYQMSAEYQYIPSIQDDLKSLNLSCEADDSCAEKRVGDSLQRYGCHCGSHCVQLDTCCLDSPYVAVPKPKVIPTCRSAYNGRKFFMVDRCPSSDSAWEDLCREEWNGEDDIFKIMPITSLQTSITYKNYFCFKCYETNEDFVHWTLRLTSNEIAEGYNASNESVALHFDISEGKWIAVIGDDEFSFPVDISIHAPQNIAPIVRDCKGDVVSSCSEHWTDEDVRNKCGAYTAVKQTFRDGWTFVYKNVHCAACNFEMIENFSCLGPPATGFGFGVSKFSFTHLLDINRRDGDLVGRIQRCDEAYVWDPYHKKCRKLTCALPGYSVQNGKCVAG